MATTWTYDGNTPRQLGGKGGDYQCWFRGKTEVGTSQFVVIQIGQCGDAPDGDTLAKAVSDAMLAGLNAAGLA